MRDPARDAALPLYIMLAGLVCAGVGGIALGLLDRKPTEAPLRPGESAVIITEQLTRGTAIGRSFVTYNPAEVRIHATDGRELLLLEDRPIQVLDPGMPARLASDTDVSAVLQSWAAELRKNAPRSAVERSR